MMYTMWASIYAFQLNQLTYPMITYPNSFAENRPVPFSINN